MSRVPRLVWAFVLAAFVSNIGTHMQAFSEQWLVLLQAGPLAARWAGRMSAASGIGVALATPLGGWIADHWRRGRSLAATQVGLTALSSLMALLVWKGRLGLHGLVACAFSGGLMAGLMLPLQLSLVGGLQPDSASLFGMMQVQWNSSRILGPLAAAALFLLVGAAGNFALNALSFLPLIVVILRLPDRAPATAHRREAHYGTAAKALWAPGLREVICTAALFGLMGWSLLILAPVYGSRFLSLGERGVAGLFACFGAGAVTSGLAVATRRLGRDTGRSMRQGLGIFAIALAFTAFPGKILTPLLLLVAGFGSGLAVTSLGSRVRELAPRDLLGRINALYALAIVGLSPLGTLAAGEAAQALGFHGPRWVLGAQGLLMLAWWVRLRIPSRAGEAPSIPA